MNRIQLALFPALLLGTLAVVFFASLAEPSVVVLASDDAITPTSTVAQPEIQPSAQAAATLSYGSCPISTRFPAEIRQWCRLIDQSAKPLGLDDNLIAAMMWQESGGNPKAYSKSGAVGLMQVMPRDGLAAAFQCTAGPCFSARPSMAQLFDPEFNISYGVRMLAGLAQKSGSLRNALRAYGPMDVDFYYADKVLKIYASYR
jgi:soluble lytic murein transglycosylase-like protein